MPDTIANTQIDELRARVSKMLQEMDPLSPIGATVVFSVQRSRESDFKRNASELAAATQKLPGCRFFVYLRRKPIDPEPPDSPSVPYLIIEEWDSVDLFRAQWNSDHLKHFQNTVSDLLTGQPDLNFFYGSQMSRRTRVLRTGQKRYWDRNGKVTAPAGSGADGELRAGVAAPTPRFIDNNNGSVTDRLTGLIWLKDANLFGEVTWDDALQNARKLAAGSGRLADGSKAGDWRLPNVNELQSILELDNTSGPAVAPDHPFDNLVPANYWTATSVAAAPPLGWYTALGVGPPVFDLKINFMRMWPVRGGENARIARTGQNQCFNSWGQPIDCAGSGQDAEFRMGVPFPDPRFHDNGDGSVTDNLTGLTWLKDANAFGTTSWDNALSACRKLSSGTGGLSDSSIGGDWRLPNLFELRSLMDYSTFGPALTPGHPFDNVQTSLYWSSTTVPSAPNLARFVFVGIGPSVWDHKSVQMHVWPVKGGR